MKRDRRLVIAGAVAAIVLLAVPALALASVWRDHGTAVNKLVELNLTGGELFKAEKGGMSCKVKAVMSTEGESKAKIQKWQVTECPTGFEEMKSCQMLTSEPKNLPWAVTVNASDLTISKMTIKRTFKTGCVITELEKTITSTKVTLDIPSEIKQMEFEGETTGYKVSGSLEVEGANNGTYSIG